MFQSPGEIAFELGFLQVRWYGILIAIGIAVAYTCAMREARRRALNVNAIADGAFWAVLCGVLGARLYYVLFQWSYFSEHPDEIFKVWHGGLAIHGALLGGLLVFVLFMRKRKLSFFRYADCMILAVPFAQALGRWGNFFNSEAFGEPSTLPWALFIPEPQRPAGFEDFSTFHPTFLYESLWDVALFFLLVYMSRRWFSAEREKAAPGSLLALYMIFYSIGRFFIEGIRLDSLYVGPLRIAQVMSFVLIILGIFGFYWLNRRPRNLTK